jgi:hypothetical protein
VGDRTYKFPKLLLGDPFFSVPANWVLLEMTPWSDAATYQSLSIPDELNLTPYSLPRGVSGIMSFIKYINTPKFSVSKGRRLTDGGSTAKQMGWGSCSEAQCFIPSFGITNVPNPQRACACYRDGMDYVHFTKLIKRMYSL